jgi:uncharacterized protein (DUF1499 family)
MATFGAALVFSALAILLGLASFIVIWRQGLRGLGHALTGMAISFALLAYPSYLAYRAYELPAIVDITTDTIDPPRFEAIARLRGRSANPVAYAGLYSAEQQHDAYPDIEPLELSVTPKMAYDTALALANRNRWLVIDAREPLPGRRDGRIEAVARSPIMGFREDVLVRIRGNGDEARVDMRSASRYGRHDIGSNAKRITGYFGQIEDAVDAMLDRQERLERRASQQKKPVKGTATKGQANQPPARR